MAGDMPNGTATPPTASNATNGSPSGPNASQATGGSSNVNGTSQSQRSNAQQTQQSSQSSNNQANAGGGSPDPATAKKPRDARLIHMVLANLGVRTYEDRVPLQLMDFAYRHTVGVLQDAISLGDMAASQGNSRVQAQAGDGAVSLNSLRLAIAARLGQQFQPPLPKEFMFEIAQERNRVALPRAERMYGLRLPPEQFCQTGTAWGLKEEWDSEGEEDADTSIVTLQKQEDEEDDTVMGEADEEDMAEFEEVMGNG